VVDSDKPYYLHFQRKQYKQNFKVIRYFLVTIIEVGSAYFNRLLGIADQTSARITTHYVKEK